MRLLYGGSIIFDYEVNKTLWADIRLTIFTMVFVAAFVLIFTQFSFFLTWFGIISIVTPLCLAYFLFRVAFDIQSLGILSGISVFIIIGIGVDDVFVFINTFRQAHSARSLETRMAHSLCTAGKATFFTSFTTAAAFAANCFSKVRFDKSIVSMGGGGGVEGRVLQKKCVWVCGPLPKTLTLFMTKICNFLYPVYELIYYLTKNLIPYL